MPTSTDSPQFKYLAIAFFINAAKVVQIERNTKGKQVFLCITEPMEQREPTCLHDWRVVTEVDVVICETALSGEAQGDLI